jgi:hypothetical protein
VPVNAAERLLGEVAALLGRPEAELAERARAHSLLQLGGDSLVALRVVAAAQAHCGLAVRLGDLLGAEALHSVIARAEPVAPRAAGEQTVTQAAPVQAAVLAAGELFGQAATRLVVAARISGPLDPARLALAVERVSLHRPTLRSYFPRTEQGWARRVAKTGLKLEILTLSCFAGEAAAAVENLLDGIARAPMDHERHPPVRALLAVFEADPAAEAVLLLAAHHAIVDGWSLGVLMREIFQEYAGTPAAAGDQPARAAQPSPRVRAARLAVRRKSIPGPIVRLALPGAQDGRA